MIHIKCQDLLSLKNKKKIFECRLLQILLSAFTVNLHKSYMAELGLELVTPGSEVKVATDCTVELGSIYWSMMPALVV